MKSRVVVVLVVVAAGALSGGCASIITGSRQDVAITTDPSGATVAVDGQEAVSPARFNLKRKHSYTVVVEKEGYATAQRRIGKTFNVWTLGNLILGGIIGIGVDLITGAFWALDPDDMYIILQKEGSAQAPPDVGGLSPETRVSRRDTAPQAAGQAGEVARASP